MIVTGRCRYVTRWHDGLPLIFCEATFNGYGSRCPDHAPQHHVTWPTNPEETTPAMTDDTEPPPTPALDAWYETHEQRRNDTAQIRLWMPQRMPNARPEVIHGGCDRPDMLNNPERPLIHVDLGPVEIGGFGDEIEQYFTAALEMIRYARWQAGRIDRAYRRWETADNEADNDE